MRWALGVGRWAASVAERLPEVGTRVLRHEADQCLSRIVLSQCICRSLYDHPLSMLLSITDRLLASAQWNCHLPTVLSNTTVGTIVLSGISHHRLFFALSSCWPAMLKYLPVFGQSPYILSLAHFAVLPTHTVVQHSKQANKIS